MKHVKQALFFPQNANQRKSKDLGSESTEGTLFLFTLYSNLSFLLCLLAFVEMLSQLQISVLT